MPFVGEVEGVNLCLHSRVVKQRAIAQEAVLRDIADDGAGSVDRDDIDAAGLIADFEVRGRHVAIIVVAERREVRADCYVMLLAAEIERLHQACVLSELVERNRHREEVAADGEAIAVRIGRNDRAGCGIAHLQRRCGRIGGSRGRKQPREARCRRLDVAGRE